MKKRVRTDATISFGEEGPMVALTFEDLAVGTHVSVKGLLDVTGEVLADEIDVADEGFDTTP